MHSLVEGWLPVPKALPGSKRMIFRSKNFSGTSNHAGKIKIDFPT